MSTPNFFLADLPPETLTPAMVSEACIAIKRNRAQFLLKRNTSAMVRVIADVASDWQDPAYPFRRRALEDGPPATGFSQATIARGLDAFFAQLTKRNLEALIIQDLGHISRLDGLTSSDSERSSDRAALATGPELLVHIAGGVLPNPTLTSMVLGFLARSAQFVKCPSRGGDVFPRLFAHSIYAVEPKLGACLELAAWPGGSVELENALFAHATCVTATGSDETLAAIRNRLPGHARFLGYGHRISLAYVAQEMLAAFTLPKVVAKAADDITAWDQLGCLSPHAIYVETGGAVGPERFAELLAEELAAREVSQPRGQLAVEESAAIAARRHFYNVRAAAAPSTRIWFSADSTAWSVVCEDHPDFQKSCLNRFVYVKAILDPAQFFVAIDSMRGQVSTVGLAAPSGPAQRLANDLAAWGVTRICPLGQMQNPPLTWRHDGRPPLGDLLTWTDLEMTF